MLKKDLEYERKWVKLREKLKEVIGKELADLNAVLFLSRDTGIEAGAKKFQKKKKT